ncbi:MAG: hypothetical protein AB7K24_31810 [Gemmataceae bacterium]
MPEHIIVRASCIFKGISQARETLWIEMTAWQDALIVDYLGKAWDEAVTPGAQHGLVLPALHEGTGAHWQQRAFWRMYLAPCI